MTGYRLSSPADFVPGDPRSKRNGSIRGQPATAADRPAYLASLMYSSSPTAHATSEAKARPYLCDDGA